MTGTNYLLLLPTLLTISFIFISVDWFLHSRQLKDRDLNIIQETEDYGETLRKKNYYN